MSCIHCQSGCFAGLLLAGLVLVHTGADAACTAANPNANVVEATPTIAFTDNGDGTVTHNLSGLIWDRCSLGMALDENGTPGDTTDDACTGTADIYSWQNALQQAVIQNSATYLGYEDWRLPNQKELLSIVETCGYSPAINQMIFPATPSWDFWSASSYISYPAHAWAVRSQTGYGYHYDKTTDYYVRLVRGGQPDDSFDRLMWWALDVVVAGSGSVSGPEGIACLPNCSAFFADGSQLTLTATPDAEWDEASQNWSNDCDHAGSSSICILDMDGDKQADVSFHCELIRIPESHINTDVSPWQCAKLEAKNVFEIIGPDGDVSFEAKTSIELGAGFRVGDQAKFRAIITP